MKCRPRRQGPAPPPMLTSDTDGMLNDTDKRNHLDPRPNIPQHVNGQQRASLRVFRGNLNHFGYNSAEFSLFMAAPAKVENRYFFQRNGGTLSEDSIALCRLQEGKCLS